MCCDGVVEDGAAGPVTGMLFLAVLFGLVAGLVSGLLYRVAAHHLHAYPSVSGWAPATAFVVVSLLAWLFIGLFASRWGNSDDQPLPSSRVIEACAAWLLYVAIAYLAFRALRGRAGRPAPPPERRPHETRR